MIRPSPVLKWPGSKWNMAEWIIANMPRHDCYIEPYFGSGAVFFTKPPCKVELINDLDGGIVSLFRLVRERPEELADMVALTPWSREEYDHCRKNLNCDDELESARRLIVAMCQGIGVRRSVNKDFNATTGWRSRDVAHQCPTTTWRRMPEHIHAAAQRLLKAQIENRPALDVIYRHNGSEILHYVDPPYHPETRSRRLYSHEMSNSDHKELLAVLDNHSGPVLLSGYDSSLYSDSLPHWHRREITVRAQNNASRREVLWINPIAANRLAQEQRERQRPLMKLMEAS